MPTNTDHLTARLADKQLVDKTRHILQSANLRCTPGRMAIIKTLIRTTTPLSESQILETIPQAHLNKTTIYRAMTCFMEAGIIHQAYIKDRSRYYELAHRCSHQQCHPHFTCTQCGQTECMTELNLPLAHTKKGHLITRQKVELEGLCPDCKKYQTR